MRREDFPRIFRPREKAITTVRCSKGTLGRLREVARLLEEVAEYDEFLADQIGPRRVGLDTAIVYAASFAIQLLRGERDRLRKEHGE